MTARAEVTGGRSVTRVAAPAVDLLSLAEVKAHARVDHDDEDDVLTACRDAAVARLDGWRGELGRALVNQTWRLSLDAAPAGAALALPLPDVSSIAEITYDDADGVAQVLAPESWRLIGAGLRCGVELTAGAAWPELADRAGALRVDFVTGYGAAAADVPADIRVAALMIAATLYDHRSDIVVGASVAEIPARAQRLLSRHRVPAQMF